MIGDEPTADPADDLADRPLCSMDARRWPGADLEMAIETLAEAALAHSRAAAGAR